MQLEEDCTQLPFQSNNLQQQAFFLEFKRIGPLLRQFNGGLIENLFEN